MGLFENAATPRLCNLPESIECFESQKSENENNLVLDSSEGPQQPYWLPARKQKEGNDKHRPRQQA